MIPSPGNADDGVPDPERAKASFKGFYEEHRSLALVVLRMALGGTGIDVDEIAATMWAQIWARWRARGPVVEAPRAYVRKCAAHAAADAHALRVRTVLPLDVDELSNLADPRPVPDTPALPELTDPRLNAAVDELSNDERRVILAWIATYPPPTSAQIGQDLNMHPSTVRRHRTRAVKKLRDIFGAPDDGTKG